MAAPARAREAEDWGHGPPGTPVAAGWVVGVTADRRAAEQAALLERRGARVIHGPVLRTVVLEAGDEVAGAVDALVARPPDVVVLGDAVRRLGADVVPVPVYRWTPPEDGAPARRLVDGACDGRLDAVTFTAAPAVSNLLALAEAAGRDGDLLAALAGPVAAVSVGPVCTAAAVRAGVAPRVEPKRPRLGAMVQALADHAEATDAAAAQAVDGRRVVLRAAAVVVDGQAVELPPRERAVLAALLDRPGAVAAKDHLARTAWGAGADADPHAVEVAVGRLRRRLDGLLDVRALPRRGYLLTAG